MRLFFLFLLFCLPCCVVKAQKLYPLNSITDSARFQLVVQQQALVLQWADGTPVWKQSGNFPKIRSVHLEEGDLIIEYLQGKATDQSSYSFAMRVTAADGPIVLPNGYEIVETTASDGQTTFRRYIWQDAAETLFAPGRTYTLFLTRRLMGNVNCEKTRPSFTTTQQLPYYGGMIAGAVSGGVGIYLLQLSNNEYKRYREVWENEGTDAQARPFLQRAEKADRHGQLLLYSGLAIMATDAVLYYLKHRKIRQKQRLYDEFCTNKTSLQWHPGIQIRSNGRVTVGTTLSYRF